MGRSANASGALRSKLTALISVAFFLMITAHQAFAQTGSSSDVSPAGDEMMLFQEIPSVFSASKYEQKVTEAPSSVSIITAAEIKKYGYRTLADILRSVRGFYITSDRNYSYAGVRGFDRPGDFNTRILLLLDGHRTNDNIYDQAFIGHDFIADVDLIDRVEIVRGPSSSLYGSNAFFAVVNVITRRGRDIAGGEVSADLGGYRAHGERLTAGRRHGGGMEFIASASWYNSDGARNIFFPEYFSPATNYGIAHNADAEEAKSFFAKSSFSDFTLEAAYHKREKDIPTGAYETVFNTPQTRTIDTRSFMDLKYQAVLAGRWDVMARLYYDWYGFEGDYLFDYPPLTLNRDKTRGEWWGAEGQVSKKLGSHKLTAGAEAQVNLKQDQANFDVAPYFPYLDDVRNSTKWAAYLQDEFNILSNLILNAGLRYDDYETFGGELNPRAALIFNPYEKTTFKLLYGEAFRAPNVYELYYNDGGNTTLANPLLQPEEIRTTELVYEQYLGDHLRMTAAGFYYKIKDLITQQLSDPADPLSPLIYRNVDQTKALGAEVEVENRWESGIEARMSYTYQKTEDAATGKILSNSPRQLAKLNFILPLVKDHVFTGVEEQYLDKRRTLTDKYAGAYWLTNLTMLVRNVPRNMDLSVGVYNLFDKEYGDPGSEEHKPIDSIPQDGRNFRVKLTYKF